jgi:hypothetical protein
MPTDNKRCCVVEFIEGKPLLCPDPVSSDDPIDFDATGMVEAIWHNYGASAMQQGQQLLSKGRLAAIDLPFEVVEAHFLTELYRPHAFPALFAKALSTMFAERSPQKLIVSFPETAGCLRDLSEKFNRLGKSDISWKAWFAPLGAVAILLGSVLKLSKRAQTRRPLDSPTGWIACIFEGQGTHTRHLWTWLLNQPDTPVLVLGHRATTKQIQSQAKSAGLRLIHPLRIQDFPSAVMRLFRIWHALITLHREVEMDLGIRCPFSFHVKTAVWILRGFLHESWIRRENFPKKAKVVHGLIAHADSRIADLAFRNRGVDTVHWIHGVVEDALHFRANCSVGLCVTPNDHLVRSLYGNYGVCIGPSLRSREPKIPKLPGNGLLIVTNLIHPDNRFSKYGGDFALRRLLSEVSKAMPRDTPITWRPHPRESATPGFAELEGFASTLGIAVNNEIPFADQINACCWAVSTLSTSIGDLAGAGLVPAIFTGIPADKSGHARVIPKDISFQTAVELRTIIQSLKDPVLNQGLLELLLNEYPPSRPTPSELVLA